MELLVARRLIGALAAAHLVELVGRHRYRLHDLLRTYAIDRVEQEQDPADRDNAGRRLIEWYAHHTTTALAIEFPWHAIEPPPDVVASGSPEITFADREAVAAWQQAEQANLVAIVRWTATHFTLPQLTLLLLRKVGALVWFRSNGAETMDACRAAVAMARRSGAQDVEAELLAHLAEQLLLTPDRPWVEAAAVAQQALALAQHLQQPFPQASALNTLALVCLGQLRYDEAVGYLQRALPLSVGYQRGRFEGAIEGNLSEAYTGLGHYEQAIQHALREHALRRQAGDRGVDCMLSLHLARARQGQGAHHEVISICSPAIGQLENQQIFPRHTAELLNVMAVSLNAIHERAAALDCWRRAVATFDVYDYPRAVEIRDRIHDLDQPSPREKQSGS